LLGALAIVARHRGIHLSPAQLRRDYRIAADGPTSEELLRITRANGLRAVPARLVFDDLMQMGRALPAILVLKKRLRHGSPADRGEGSAAACRGTRPAGG
jgi:ATP-binding cassette subfamily B protein